MKRLQSALQAALQSASHGSSHPHYKQSFSSDELDYIFCDIQEDHRRIRQTCRCLKVSFLLSQPSSKLQAIAWLVILYKVEYLGVLLALHVNLRRLWDPDLFQAGSEGQLLCDMPLGSLALILQGKRGGGNRPKLSAKLSGNPGGPSERSWLTKGAGKEFSEAIQRRSLHLVMSKCNFLMDEGIRGTRKLRDELKDHSDESLQETLLAAQLQESLLWAYILWQLADSSQIPSIQSDYLQINISYGWRLLDQLSAIFVKFDTSINKAKSLGVNHTLSRRCAKFLSKGTKLAENALECWRLIIILVMEAFKKYAMFVDKEGTNYFASITCLLTTQLFLLVRTSEFLPSSLSNQVIPYIINEGAVHFGIQTKRAGKQMLESHFGVLLAMLLERQVASLDRWSQFFWRTGVCSNLTLALAQLLEDVELISSMEKDLTGQFEALNGGLYALGILLLHPKSGRQAEVLQAFMCGSRALEVFSEFSEYATSPQLNIFTTVPTVHDSVADKLASCWTLLTAAAPQMVHFKPEMLSQDASVKIPFAPEALFFKTYAEYVELHKQNGPALRPASVVYQSLLYLTTDVIRWNWEAYFHVLKVFMRLPEPEKLRWPENLEAALERSWKAEWKEMTSGRPAKSAKKYKLVEREKLLKAVDYVEAFAGPDVLPKFKAIMFTIFLECWAYTRTTLQYPVLDKAIGIMSKSLLQMVPEILSYVQSQIGDVEEGSLVHRDLIGPMDCAASLITKFDAKNIALKEQLLECYVAATSRRQITAFSFRSLLAVTKASGEQGFQEHNKLVRALQTIARNCTDFIACWHSGQISKNPKSKDTKPLGKKQWDEIAFDYVQQTLRLLELLAKFDINPLGLDHAELSMEQDNIEAIIVAFYWLRLRPWPLQTKTREYLDFENELSGLMSGWTEPQDLASLSLLKYYCISLQAVTSMLTYIFNGGKSPSPSSEGMVKLQPKMENFLSGILEWISSLPLLTEFHKRASQQQLCVQTLVDSEGVTNELGNCTRIIQNTIHQLSNISILRMHNLVSNQDLVNKAFTLRIDIAQTLQRPEQDQLQLEQPSREQEGAIQAQKIAMELLAAEEEEKARKLKKKEKRSKAKEKKLAKISSGAVASAEAVLEKIDISKESEVGASDSKARTIPGPPTDLQTSKAVSLGKENSRLEEEAGHSQDKAVSHPSGRNPSQIDTDQDNPSDWQQASRKKGKKGPLVSLSQSNGKARKSQPSRLGSPSKAVTSQEMDAISERVGDQGKPSLGANSSKADSKEGSPLRGSTWKQPATNDLSLNTESWPVISQAAKSPVRMSALADGSSYPDVAQRKQSSETSRIQSPSRESLQGKGKQPSQNGLNPQPSPRKPVLISPPRKLTNVQTITLSEVRKVESAGDRSIDAQPVRIVQSDSQKREVREGKFLHQDHRSDNNADQSETPQTDSSTPRIDFFKDLLLDFGTAREESSARIQPENVPENGRLRPPGWTAPKQAFEPSNQANFPHRHYISSAFSDDEEEIPRKTQRSESQKSLLSNELPPDGRGTSLKDRMPRPLLQNRGARNLQASDVASNTSVDSEEQDWTPLGPSSDTYSKIRMEIRAQSPTRRRPLPPKNPKPGGHGLPGPPPNAAPVPGMSVRASGGHGGPRLQTPRPEATTSRVPGHMFSAEQLEQFYTCPITQEILVDPVIAMDGFTYERLAISSWLVKHDTSPLTNEVLPSKHLQPNLLAKQMIEAIWGSS